MTDAANRGPSITVVIPSSGRPTLAAAVSSVAPQLEPGDELIVVVNDDGDFGNSARNSAIERARGEYLAFLDDDDEFLPDALANMRQAARAHPNRIVNFKCTFESRPGGPLPVGLVPNVAGKVGRWQPADISDPGVRPLRPGETPERLSVRWADWEFTRSTLELRGEQEMIQTGIITYLIRPEHNPWKNFRYKVRLRTRLRALRGALAGR